MSQKLSFSGAFGRAHADLANGLWRVQFDGRNDWYGDQHEASRVALSLANTGEPPKDVKSLLDLSRQKRSAS